MSGWNRIEDGQCTHCGATLISPKDSELLMCTECLANVQADAIGKIKSAASRTGGAKRVKIRLPMWMISDKALKKAKKKK